MFFKPTIMKIVSTGSTLSSPEFHEKRKRARRRRLYWWAAGVFTLLSVLIFLSRQEKFLVSAVSVEGAKTVNSEMVEAEVKEILSGHYLWLVPRSNFILYPRREVKSALLNEFPRFSAVDLELEGSRRLSVLVTEREPYALYCDSALSPENAAACYFLDKEGFIFDSAPSFSGSVYFIYARETPLATPLGRAFLPPGEFKPLSAFIERLEKLGIQPLALEVGADEFNLVLPHDAHLVWKRGSDLDLLYANLSAFLNDEAIKSQKDFLDRVSTLDLRTENKVFYRFKE